MATAIGIGISGDVFQTEAGIGAPAPAATCPTTYSCLYDGITEHQTNATSPVLGAGGTGNFTITFWIKTPDTTGAGVNQRLISNLGSGGSNFWSLYLTTLGKFQWVSDAIGNDGYGTFTPANDTWYHIAFSVDRSGNQSWYANAGSANTQASTGSAAFTGTDTFYIARTGGGQYFQGNLTEVAIWDKALSQAEVADLYALSSRCYGDVSFGSNLQHWWRMFNPTGVYAATMPDAAGSFDITNTNMGAGNVSTDVPT